MRRRSRASSKLAKARSRKAMPKRRKVTTVRRRSSSTKAQETGFARLARERDEALNQQAAASEVLRVISSSPGDLESVFRSILVNANRICEAHFGTIFRYDGKALVVTAWEGVPPEYLALLQSGPLPVDERTATGRAAKSKQVVHIADLSPELPSTKGDQLPTRSRAVCAGASSATGAWQFNRASGARRQVDSYSRRAGRSRISSDRTSTGEGIQNRFGCSTAARGNGDRGLRADPR